MGRWIKTPLSLRLFYKGDCPGDPLSFELPVLRGSKIIPLFIPIWLPTSRAAPSFLIGRRFNGIVK